MKTKTTEDEGGEKHTGFVFSSNIFGGGVRKEERVEINIDFVFHYTQWSTHLQHTIPVPDE